MMKPECDNFVGPWTTDLVRCIACRLELFDAFRIRQCAKVWRDTIDFMMRERPSWATRTIIRWVCFLGCTPHISNTIPVTLVSRKNPQITKHCLPNPPHFAFLVHMNLNDKAEGCGCHLCGKPMVWTYRYIGTFPMRKLCPDIGCALGMEIARIRNLCVCSDFKESGRESFAKADSKCSVNHHCTCDKKSTFTGLCHICRLSCIQLVNVMPCFALK